MSNKTIEELLAEEAESVELAEVDADANAPLPDGMRVTRGHGRSRTLQVRLNGDEYEWLEHLAKSRSLPVSTVARSLLITSMSPSDDAGTVLARIEGDLAVLRRKVEQS